MFIPSKFAHFSETPKNALNWHLLLAVASVGLLGASRGVDEGLISGQMTRPSFQESFGIKPGSHTESNVVAMVQLLSILGALLGYLVVDRIGRLRGVQLSCIINVIGNIFWIASGGRIGLLYFGRALIGVAVGMTPICAPVFMVEVAPEQIRGLCTSIYSVNVYLGLLLAYCANLGSKQHINPESSAAWQVPLSLNFGLHALVFLGTLFIQESPRWLMTRDNDEKAAESLSYYRKLPVTDLRLIEEFETILVGVRQERNVITQYSIGRKLKMLFFSRNNLYKLMLCIAIQIFGQWQGPGAISTYANRILSILGLSDSKGYIMSAGFGAVKYGGGLLSAFLLIDLFGRRKTLMVFTALQGIALLYLSVYLGLYLEGNATKNKDQAGEAALACVFIAGLAWSAGGNLAQYLINTEIFSLELRSLSASIIMVLHFAFQYSTTRAFTPMMESKMGGAGAFGLFTGMSALALIFYTVFLPETAGRPLEEMEELFNLPWYRIGTAGRYHSSPGSHPQFVNTEDSEVERKK